MSNFNEPVPLSMLGTPIRGIATLPSALQEPRPPDLCPCGKWKWRVRGPLLARVACKASSETAVLCLVFQIRRVSCACLPFGYC